MKVTYTGAWCLLMSWSFDVNFQTEVLIQWVWIRMEDWHCKQAPIRQTTDCFVYHCPLSFEQTVALFFWKMLWLPFVSERVSFFDCLIFHLLKISLHISEPPLSLSHPIKAIWSSPCLPLWVSISLEFWELIISWRKSTRCWKQKEIFQWQKVTCEVRSKSGVQYLTSFLRIWPLHIQKFN